MNAQQRILLLKKKGNPKNYKYFLASEISLRNGFNDRKVTGQIHMITDTSIIVNYNIEVFIDQITWMYRERYFFRLLSPILMVAGGGYFILDGFNRAINKQYPIITENNMLISGVLIGVGLVIKPLGTKRYRIGKRWELQMLDMSY
jgi:hypothetical protein